jgi:ketosteroid isomerase-like protein
MSSPLPHPSYLRDAICERGDDHKPELGGRAGNPELESERKKEAEMKARMLFLTVLVVLLVLPSAIYAQETDPEAVATAFFEAFNAGDVESAVAYYADDAVWHIVPFHEPYTGEEEIRTACEAMVAKHAVVEYEILQVEGDTVALRNWYADDSVRALGLKLEATQEIIVRDGKIVSNIWIATDETLAAYQAALANLPVTGGGALPIDVLVTALGGLAVAGSLGLRSLHRRSHQA